MGRGTAIFAEESLPLIAGYERNGTRKYVAQLDFRDEEFRCTVCYAFFRGFFASVAEGTRPEDLVIEVTCPHQTKRIIPSSMTLMVLRYPLDEYPEASYTGRDGDDATGPFSWKPADQCDVWDGQYTVRVIPVAEIEEGEREPDTDELALTSKRSSGPLVDRVVSGSFIHDKLADGNEGMNKPSVTGSMRSELNANCDADKRTTTPSENRTEGKSSAKGGSCDEAASGEDKVHGKSVLKRGIDKELMCSTDAVFGRPSDNDELITDDSDESCQRAARRPPPALARSRKATILKSRPKPLRSARMPPP